MDTSKVHFYKEIFSNRYVCNGAAVDFEQLDGNRGVVELTPGQHDQLIQCLTDAAQKHMGGIVKISADEYAQKKTLYPLPPESVRRLQQEKLRVLPTRPFGPREPGVVGDDIKQALAAAKQAAPVAPVVPVPVVNGTESAVGVGEGPGYAPATKRLGKPAGATKV